MSQRGARSSQWQRPIRLSGGCGGRCGVAVGVVNPVVGAVTHVKAPTVVIDVVDSDIDVMVVAAVAEHTMVVVATPFMVLAVAVVAIAVMADDRSSP